MRSIKSLLLFLLFSAAIAQGAVLHVPGQYPEIQQAMDAAQPGDTVLVAPGVYTGVSGCVVQMKSEVVLLSEVGPPTTIIDGQGQRRVLCCDYVNPATVVDGFTIRNGHAADVGGGIRLIEGNLAVRNCVIEDNWAGSAGAGLHLYRSSPQVSDCVIRGNVAPDLGEGAVFVRFGDPAFTRCRIAGNQSVYGTFFINGARVILEDCVIEENTASVLGGGVAILGTYRDCVFRRCTVRNNVSAGRGGGLWAQDVQAPITIEDSEVSGSSGTEGGALYLDGCPQVSLIGSTVSNNTCSPGSGAVFLKNGSLAVCDRTIVSFSSGGFGLFARWDGSAADLSCSDVYGNQGGNYGGSLSDQTGLDGNFSADPLFCGPGDGLYTLRNDSPCLPGQHPYGVECGLIGAYGQGCTPASAPETRPSAGLRLIGPYPNPAAGAVQFGIDVPGGGHLRVELFSAAGRRIAVIADREVAPGRVEFQWPRADQQHSALPSGVYYLRWVTDWGSGQSTLVVLR